MSVVIKRRHMYNAEENEMLTSPNNHLAIFTKCGIKMLLEHKKMAKVCEICGKRPLFGQTRSHSHKASKKKWKPNLQRVKAKTNTGVKHIWVCTRCLRSGKVVKAI